MEAVIDNGQVVNIIVGHTEGSLPLEDTQPIIDSNIETIDGFVFDIQIDKVVKVYTVRPLTAEEVRRITIPTEIRMAQCRAQLIIDGKDDDVELLINSITDPIQQKLYRAYFEYEPIVKRDNPMINDMAPALAIDLDAFFIAASKL